MTALWECIWKTSAATVLVWMVTLLLRRRSAALRHSLWLCALATFILIPALLPLAHRTPPVRLAISIPAAFDVQTPAAAAPPSRSQPARIFPVERILLCVWLGGSLVLCVRRARAAFRMKQIAAQSAPAPESVTALTGGAVRISEEIRTPLTWGVGNALILLPPCALDWSRECLRSVLEHEREHIRRFDPLSHWLAELVCAAWWFHPFAWLARSRAAHERECACDDAVLRSGVRPSDYAAELLNLAATLSTKGDPSMALSALSNFERRIKNLLLPDIDRQPANSRARLAVALATVVLIVPLAILRAQAPSGQADLSGTVTDPSGARVPGAQITASGPEGKFVMTADAVGHWSFSGIPAGKYTVEVAHPGFALARTSIDLTAGQPATLPQTLSVGSVQMTIRVKAPGVARTTTQDTAEAGPIRVGGNVQAANLIRQVKPAYPPGSRAQGIEGTVLLNAVIGTDGNMLSVVVANKSVDPDLAAAALAAVQQWRFKPTLLNGEPVEVFTTVTMTFTPM